MRRVAVDEPLIHELSVHELLLGMSKTNQGILVMCGSLAVACYFFNGIRAKLRVRVRDAEGGHPSYVRRGKGGTAFGAERSKEPKGLLSDLPIS
jgi:hypothetical protein